MHDITLYGHMTVDRIFDGFEEKQTLGAMANMWRTFKQVAPDLDIGMCPTSIGEAIVYIDRDSSTRYSNFVPTEPPIFFDLYPKFVNLSVSSACKPKLIDLSVLL